QSPTDRSGTYGPQSTTCARILTGIAPLGHWAAMPLKRWSKRRPDASRPPAPPIGRAGEPEMEEINYTWPRPFLCVPLPVLLTVLLTGRIRADCLRSRRPCRGSRRHGVHPAPAKKGDGGN